MVGLNISMKVTLMPLAMAAIFLTIPMTFVQYSNWMGVRWHRSCFVPSLPARLQQFVMMLGVTGDDVCHGPNRHRRTIGDSRPLPYLWREGLEERNRRAADPLEFIKQVSQSAPIGVGFADVVVLLKSL